MKSVFSSKKMLSYTVDSVRSHITGPNPTIIKMLSPKIRERISYHSFSVEEREVLLAQVRELIDWLEDIQSDDKDFIRQALIAGLREFEFRLGRLDWFGSGYPIESLRGVIHAYMALEGAGVHSDSGQELTSAILKKTKSFMVSVLGVIDVAKETTERADWALRVYGAISILTDGGTKILGLLN